MENYNMTSGPLQEENEQIEREQKHIINHHKT